jgi:predicted DsbA family dithiol-disulfide isomerase
MAAKLSRSLLLSTGMAAVLALAVAGCPQKREGGGGEPPKQTVAEKVKLEFFVMSQCPFGTQVEDGIAPVLKKMGGDMDFSIDFIGGEKDGKLNSMHGENEVNGDKVQICAIKYAPYKYMDMFSCMNKNARSIPTNWESCAKDTGMPVDQIKTCYEGQEGTALLKASFAKAAARNARGSPTIFLNGKPYTGGRSELAFSRGLCEAYPKEKPALCASLPPPVKVPVTIVSDTRCKDCRPDFWQKRVEGIFPGAVTTVVDYGSDQGKKLYADLKLDLLPAILLGKEVQQADDYQRVSRFLQPKGDFFLFQSGARFDPTKEICDNKADDNNNSKIDCDDTDCTYAKECREVCDNKTDDNKDGKADCDDPQCKDSFMACRKDTPKRLELFIMSQCPYGVQALNAMKEVLEAFEKKIQFEIHFIGDIMGTTITSMHGQGEVDEDLREICVQKYFGKDFKFMDYIQCRNKNIKDANWQACAKEAGLDEKKIEACWTGAEGKKLLAEDMLIARGLGIGGSPSWMANGKTKFSGLDPETIKTEFCKANPGLKGCDKKLSGPPARPQGQAAPACGQ